MEIFISLTLIVMVINPHEDIVFNTDAVKKEAFDSLVECFNLHKYQPNEKGSTVFYTNSDRLKEVVIKAFEYQIKENETTGLS